jgi:serine/threonine protein kinase
MQANVSSPAPVEVVNSTFPPLPSMPEAAIFDPPYADKIAAVFNDSNFPPKTPPQKIYYTRLKVVEAILTSRKESAESVSINLIAAWVSIVLLCVFLLVRIRRNRQRALLGDADAARKIVLPAFEPLLWMLGGINVILLMLFGVMLVAGDVSDYYNRLTIELAIAVKLFNGMLIITYMLQPSLSLRALWHAVLLALLWSGYTIPVVLVLNASATPDNQRVCYWMLMASRGALLVYVFWLTLYPPARASTRSFRILCVYVVGMNLMLCCMSEAYHRGSTESAKALGWAIAVYSLILPICVWNVLRADTEHWRGIGKRAVELQDTFRRQKGKIEERVSSQGLHVLIEMHRKYIIDFARLQFYEPIADAREDRNKTTMYRGYLHSKKTPVAIKVYMPTTFTEETVAAFSHEAALCGALVHPNILKFHGLCVCPPNICLVTELCEGSLRDVLEAQSTRLRRGRNLPLRRQDTLVAIGYMIDAARALAYLHSFSPAFVHRDIKPSSFLIDDQGTVKLTDFGASRTLSVRSTNGRHHPGRVAPANTRQASGGSLPNSGQTVLEMPKGLTKRTMQYIAPEMTTSHPGEKRTYGESADVYSLAMTMWEILHPGEDMYPLGLLDKNSPTIGDAEIFEMVLAGYRPRLDQQIHFGLRQLLTAAWHANPRMRPTTQTIVASLEAIQEELCAAFAPEFMDEMSDRGGDGVRAVSVTAATPRADEPKSFAGTHAVETLRICQFVDSPREAIRLGNMLMDCGFLHHTKHSRSFVCADTWYVFDVDMIVASQPLTLLESENEARDVFRSGEGTLDIGDLKSQDYQRASVAIPPACRVRADTQSSRVLLEHSCPCRKLGQRMETESSTRRRFLRKFTTFSSENLLTAQLLADDEEPDSTTGEGDFAAFNEPSDLHTDQVDIQVVQS